MDEKTEVEYIQNRRMGKRRKLSQQGTGNRQSKTDMMIQRKPIYLANTLYAGLMRNSQFVGK